MTIEPDRFVSPKIDANEHSFDKALRPAKLKEYIGQQSVKERLEIFIQAAIGRSEVLDHTLIFGPPGLGKTTLANIIANEMSVDIKATSGPVLEKPGDLAAMLTNLNQGDVVFVDEIHRLNPVVEEILYPAMEDFQLDILIGEGPAARSLKLDLPPFTLIGATTRAGLLTSPLRDRFGIVERLDFYAESELSEIVQRSSSKLELPIEDLGCQEVARRSRGTPRIANRLLRRVRDFVEVKADGVVTSSLADQALNLLKVDKEGLDSMDRKLLSTIIENFQGGPVGLEALAASLNEEKDTIDEVIEPYLIQKGYLVRTPRGRTVTQKSYLHFGIEKNIDTGEIEKIIKDQDQLQLD